MILLFCDPVVDQMPIGKVRNYDSRWLLGDDREITSNEKKEARSGDVFDQLDFTGPFNNDASSLFLSG